MSLKPVEEEDKEKKGNRRKLLTTHLLQLSAYFMCLFFTSVKNLATQCTHKKPFRIWGEGELGRFSLTENSLEFIDMWLYETR